MNAEIAIALIVIPTTILFVALLIFILLRTFQSPAEKNNLYAVAYERKGSSMIVWDIPADTPDEAISIVKDKYSATRITEVSLKVIDPENPKERGYQIVWTAPSKTGG